MRDLKEKTAAIVDRLFEDEEDSQNSLETDGGNSEDEEILNIARCLRKLGDEYNEVLQPHVKDLKLHELVKDQVSNVFSGMVTQLCSKPELQTHLEQLGPEMKLLQIAVVLGKEITKEVPSLLPTVKVAMVNFFNTQLLSWVQSSGGWENLW
ncbi:bcl-2-like protein 15 [Heterodontus francisci]|uniref:bcl-2-like protein 15 n=1 Tax=Heterodontus francisci TaxID=7792 RepID=UPI00355AF838